MFNDKSKNIFSLGLCSLAALFAIIAMSTRGWVTVTYLNTNFNVGLEVGLPTVYLTGQYDPVSGNPLVDTFTTGEFMRVGRVALGFGLLGLFLNVGSIFITGCKARGKVYSESYFGTLASCLMAALAFFFGAILYGLSVPTIAQGQALGYSVALYILSGCFATFAGCLSF